MPVSHSHELLVQSIVHKIERGALTATDLSLHADCVLESRKLPYPPNINGHVPDVYAKEVTGDAELIGEAKTSQDLECSRTRAQLEAYVEYLKNKPRGVLLISTPWISINSARSIVRSVVRRLDAYCIETHFIDYISR